MTFGPKRLLNIHHRTEVVFPLQRNKTAVSPICMLLLLIRQQISLS